MKKGRNRFLLSLMVSAMLVSSFGAVSAFAEDTPAGGDQPGVSDGNTEEGDENPNPDGSTQNPDGNEGNGIPTLNDNGGSSGSGTTTPAITTIDALNAAIAQGGMVTLDADITGSVTVPAGVTVTLNLNGHSITSSTNHAITNNGNLTIEGSGTVSASGSGHAAIYTSIGSTTTLNGGSYTRTDEWYTVVTEGTMTINSAEVYANNALTSSNIRNLGTLTVNKGANIYTTSTIAIKNDENGANQVGNLIVTGGTISSPNQSIQNWGTARITGNAHLERVSTWAYQSGSYIAHGRTTIEGNAKVDLAETMVYRGLPVTTNQAKDYPSITVNGNAEVGLVRTSTVPDGSSGEEYAPNSSANIVIEGSGVKVGNVAISSKKSELEIKNGATVTGSVTVSDSATNSNVTIDKANTGAVSVNAGTAAITASTTGSISAAPAAAVSVDKPSIVNGDVTGNVDINPLTKVTGDNNTTSDVTYTVVIVKDGKTETKTGLLYPAVKELMDTEYTGYGKSATEENGTVTISYTLSQYTVSFDWYGSSAYAYGTVIILPDAPSTIYNFAGWTDGTRFYYPGERYTVTGNVSFSAVIDRYVPVEPSRPSTTVSKKDGWSKSGSSWYLYDSGKKLTGWQKVGNTWYYLDPDNRGKMISGGLHTIDGVTYYFYDWGGMANSWWYEPAPGEWYYFRGNGALAKNAWIEWKGEYYYVGEDGKMLVSTVVPGGYEVDQNGKWIK